MNLKTTTGDYIYRDEMNAGRFLGIPMPPPTRSPPTRRPATTDIFFGNRADLMIRRPDGPWRLTPPSTAPGRMRTGVQHNAFEENLHWHPGADVRRHRRPSCGELRLHQERERSSKEDTAMKKALFDTVAVLPYTSGAVVDRLGYESAILAVTVKTSQTAHRQDRALRYRQAALLRQSPTAGCLSITLWTPAARQASKTRMQRMWWPIWILT